MISRALTFDQTVPLRLISGLLIALVLSLLVAYIGFVNATILKIVAWQNAEKKIAVIHPQLGELEAQYLSLERGITMDKAASLNFQEADNPQFISRDAMNRGLSLGTGM